MTTQCRCGTSDVSIRNRDRPIRHRDHRIRNRDRSVRSSVEIGHIQPDQAVTFTGHTGHVRPDWPVTLGRNTRYAARTEDCATSALPDPSLFLVDPLVRVDHFYRGDPGLVELLERSAVSIHPFVIGETACGSLRYRDAILEPL